MATATIPRDKQTETITVSYEHPFVVRLAHWLNAVALLVMITSGLRIFRAFPSFGAKIPQQNFCISASGYHARRLAGRRAAMALHLHVDLRRQRPDVCRLPDRHRPLAAGAVPAARYPGVWPMVRHYFLFGKKPPVVAAYNPLQKLAYTSTIFFGMVSFLSGLVMYKPVQFWWLTLLLGGFRLARIWHFMAMCGFVAFIPGHLIMVALHGWNNFYSMITGWKREPEYIEGSGVRGQGLGVRG